MIKTWHSAIFILLVLLISLCQQPQLKSDDDHSDLPQIEHLSDQIKINPDGAELWLARGKAFYDLGSYDAAIFDLSKAVQLDSSQLEAWHLLADVYLDYYQSRPALETMERVAKLFPENIGTLLKLAEFELILKRYSEAFQTLNQIEEIQANHPEAIFMKGMVAKESGDTTAAIAYFQQATARDPQIIDAWINLGQLIATADTIEASRYFNAAQSIDPKNPYVLHAKASYLTDIGRTNEALHIYRELVDYDPYYADAYYNMGLLFLQIDSLFDAKQHFELTVKTEPGYGRAYYYLGLLAELAGSYEEALIQYEQSLRLDPSSEDVEEAILRIQQTNK